MIKGGERSSEDGRENVETTEEEEGEEEEEEEGEEEEGKVKRRAEEDKDSYYKTLKMVKVACKWKHAGDWKWKQTPAGDWSHPGDWKTFLASFCKRGRRWSHPPNESWTLTRY